jgi:predicted nucleic acid-binding protein
MILVDTNVLSELMRPKPDKHVLDWMDDLPGSDLGLTAITVAEILYGIGSLPEGKKKQRLLDAATTMFEEYFAGRIFAFDQLAAIEYADIVLQRDRSGSPISMPDAQIAAICRVSSAGLATRNTKDFEYTGLVLINPWEA